MSRLNLLTTKFYIMKKKSLSSFKEDNLVQILTFKQKGKVQGGKNTPPPLTIIGEIGSSDINNIE